MNERSSVHGEDDRIASHCTTKSVVPAEAFKSFDQAVA
jgi:hypothetical protein